jgi:hypothetical protein
MLLIGCANTAQELDLSSYDPGQDQTKIAHYHAQEAVRLRQKSEELLNRAALYERLFGTDSDWVKGARLLAESYEEGAREHERMAGRHEAAGGSPPPFFAAPPRRPLATVPP